MGADQEIKVLDCGFVRLLGVLGGDKRVVQAARVTYGSQSACDERDKKLIAYLLEHAHFSPFEHSVFQFHVKCPLFVARQWMRHRWSSFNEVSARYTEMPEEFYRPEQFRAQDFKNKQGSVKTAELDQEQIAADYGKALESLRAAYEKMLAGGVARELARLVLPSAQYTQFYWTINARSLMNFLALRMDEHAQLEMREYANAIAGMFHEAMPWSFEAFKKNFSDNGSLSKCLHF
ncbi:MAG TPA: FAD-dependent thymidylate synthase [Elusimicrobiales bacterium]|nr:FAD-dependent thymidylate synthase [Elusimicrobiales bacterium]